MTPTKIALSPIASWARPSRCGRLVQQRSACVTSNYSLRRIASRLGGILSDGQIMGDFPARHIETAVTGSFAGRAWTAIALATITAMMLAGCVFPSNPESALRRSLLYQANEVDQQFVEILEQQASADEVLTTLERGALGSTYTILDWTDEDFDSPTLSYPGAALYEAGIDEGAVVIRVAISAGYSEGGIAPKEVIGFACAEFSGRPGSGARASLTKANVECTAPMVEKSFDGEGYLALNIY